MPREFKSLQEKVVNLGYHTEAEMLRDLYETNRLSIRQIAPIVGQSFSNVKYRLRQHGIAMRGRGGPNHVTKWEEPTA